MKSNPAITGSQQSKQCTEDFLFGDHLEETRGDILNSSVGTMDGKNVIDEYGNIVGYVKNGNVYVTIGDERVTLSRN